MTDDVPKKYIGLDRFQCRKEVVGDLSNQEFLDHIEDYQLSIGVCYRCQQIIEYLISLQWFSKDLKPFLFTESSFSENEVFPRHRMVQ